MNQNVSINVTVKDNDNIKYCVPMDPENRITSYPLMGCRGNTIESD